MNPERPPVNLGEYPKLPVYYLPEQLHMAETEYMALIRHEIVQSIQQDGQYTANLMDEYFARGAEVADAEPYGGESREEAHIGLNIAMALLRREAAEGTADIGQMRRYIEELEDITYHIDGLIVGGRTRLEDVQREIYQAIEDAHDTLDRWAHMLPD